MDAGGAHRKVELQSPDDLTFLITNLRRAAREHINAAFPPVNGQEQAEEGEEDELRASIENLVGNYISQTFTLAAPSMSINGFDLDHRTFATVYLSRPRRRVEVRPAEPEVQYEPFDGRKRARVEELAREEEDLMREIAALKRKAPVAAAKAYADAFWLAVRADEQSLEMARADADADAATLSSPHDSDGGEEAGIGMAATAGLRRIRPLPRQDRVERAYSGLVETLGRLKRDMPAAVARMERARVAGHYVLTER